MPPEIAAPPADTVVAHFLTSDGASSRRARERLEDDVALIQLCESFVAYWSEWQRECDRLNGMPWSPQVEAGFGQLRAWTLHYYSMLETITTAQPRTRAGLAAKARALTAHLGDPRDQNERIARELADNVLRLIA